MDNPRSTECIPSDDEYMDEIDCPEDNESLENNINKFFLVGTDKYITITNNSIENLQAIISGSLLPQISVNSLFTSLFSLSTNGLISKDNFENLLMEYTEYDSNIYKYFMKIFSYFDINNDKCVDILEIGSVISLYCAGSKSEKLLSLFTYFDKTGKSELSLNRIRIFLSSLLLSISMLSGSRVSNSISTTVDIMCSEFELFIGGDIPFNIDVFGAWYNQAGYKICSWIELYNLQKWPNETINELFTVCLTPTDVQLTISEEDHLLLEKYVSLFPYENRQEIINAFKDCKGKITQLEFLQRFPDEDRNLWLELFSYYDLDNDNSARLIKLLPALVFLLNEKKTEKLNFFFLCYSTETVMNKADFHLFLVELLTILLFFTSVSDFVSSIDSHCQYITNIIFEDYESEFITFEEFATWYNDVGFTLIPWIELIDCTKWPNFNTELYPLNVQNTDYSEEEEEEEREEILMKFSLNKYDDEVVYTRDDVEELQKFLNKSYLYEMSVEDIVKSLYNFTKNPIITYDQYMEGLKDLFKNTDFDKISNNFRIIFDLFDRNNTGYVNISELIIAFLFFVSGDKSSKLLTAFQILHSDSKSFNRRSARIYFQSILIIMLSISNQYRDLESDCFYSTVEKTVNQILDELWKFNINNRVSYSDYANWYSTEGCNLIPWIELFSLSKWPFSNFKDTKPPANDNMIDFSLDVILPTNEILSVSYNKAAYAKIKYISQNTQFSQLSSDDFISSLPKLSNTLTIDGYEELLYSYIDASAYEHVKDIFIGIYNYYGKTFSNVCTSAILASLCVFCDGKKSPKLTTAFQLYTSSLKLPLKEKYIYEFFTSLVLPLLIPLNLKNLTDVINNFTKAVRSSLIKYDMECIHELHYDDLCNWYGKNGSSEIMWIEFLDLNKWPFVEITKSLSSKEKDLLVYKIGSDPCYKLSITPSSTHRVQDFLDATSLGVYDPHTISNYILTLPRQLSPKESLETIRLFIPGERLTETDRKILTPFFNILLKQLLGSDDVIECGNLASVLIIFTKGSIEDKLRCCLDLYQVDMLLTKADLFKLLSTILFTIILINDPDLTYSPIFKIKEEIETISDIIFNHCSISYNQAITIDDFFSWYNAYGVTCMPWISLLDTLTWPKIK